MNWLGRCNDFDINLKQRFRLKDPIRAGLLSATRICKICKNSPKHWHLHTFPAILSYIYIFIYFFWFSIFDYIYKNLVNMLNGTGCTMSKGTTNRNTILVISVITTTFTVALLRQVRLNLYRNRLWHCDLHWVRSPTWRGP